MPIPAILAALLSSVGGILLRMAAAAISKAVIEKSLLELISYLVQRYEASAAKTEDKEDDERARRLRSVYDAWKAELDKSEAKG